MALTLLMLSGLGPARAQNTADAVKFSIAEFVVEGNTVLPVVAIERAIYPYTGPSRTIADAEAARRALEKAYHDAGHLSVLVELPAQRITNVDAEIRLVVIEAPVAQLRVTGAEYTLPSTIRAQTPSVAPGAIPDFNQLQSELGRLNSESSRREITPLITASETAGAIDVELKVKEAVPFSGFIEVNNKQAENTERGRVEASATYSNLFQLGHTIGLYWFVSPREPSQANIVALNYRVPVGGPGDSLLFGYTYSDSSTPTELGGSTIGSGDTYILQWNKQLKPVGTTQHSLTFGLAYRDQKDTNKDVA
jgi:hemolysin activation/secretion protein